MSTIDPMPYLPFINGRRKLTLKPTDRVECAVCPTTFAFIDGRAFEASRDGEVVVALFCSAICYLTAVPLECCGRC